MATIFGYDVKIQNRSSELIKIEVAQYHSEEFDGSRPEQFTENLKIKATVISLQPGETQVVRYNSASGGFWLLWKTVDPPSKQLSGVVDLVAGERVINIK